MRDPESFMLMIASIYAHGTWSLCEKQVSMTLALRKPRFGLIFVYICGWFFFLIIITLLSFQNISFFHGFGGKNK